MKATTDIPISILRGAKTVVFCGTRGIPANYGGFETAVDEVSRRFVDLGIDTEVVCRSTSFDEKITTHNGRRLTYVEGSRRRSLDTLVSSCQTARYLWRHRKRISFVFWFNNANIPGILLTRIMGIPMAVNTDGLEWRRQKWNWMFKAYYFVSSFVISRLCRHLISDSLSIQKYYRRIMLKKTSFIPYGVPSVIDSDRDAVMGVLKRFGLERGKYFLQITRIEPDNLPMKVATGFAASGISEAGHRMLVIGYKDDTPYAVALKSLHGRSGIEIMEAQYDPLILSALRRNCYCYVHGNSVGGTNPALLEAMAASPRVMAIESEFSREVLGGLGLYFRPEDLSTAFIRALNHPDESLQMKERIETSYQWDAVARAYLDLAIGQPARYAPKLARSPEAEVA